MDGESGSTSPTTADIAEGMGIVNEPPADEPLALVKKVKVKIEPDDNEKPMDLVVQETPKTRRKPATTSMNGLTTASTTSGVNVLYTYTNGAMPTVPQLVDIIPTAVNGKTVRPFKAYNANRELLTGLPTVTYPSAVPVALSGPPGAAVPLSIPTVVMSSNSVPATSSNGGSNAHLMTLATEADKLLQKDPKVKNGHIKTSIEIDEAMTPGSTSGGSEAGSSNSAGDLLEETIEKIKKRAGIDASMKTEQSTPVVVSTVPPVDIVARETNPSPKPTNNSSKKSKKSKNTLPDQMKDNHYWERRRKNNEAAKRSRDARRAKEDQIAIRAALLEQENMRLRIEVAALKEETVKLRAMLYNKK